MTLFRQFGLLNLSDNYNNNNMNNNNNYNNNNMNNTLAPWKVEMQLSESESIF